MIPTSEMGVNDKIPNYTSKYVNIDNDMPNVKVKTNGTTFRKLTSIKEISIKNGATSTSGSDTNKRADISVTPTASNYTPNFKRFVIFSILVNNNGPNAAKDVTVSYWLNPNHLKWFSDDGKGSYNHKTGIWSVGNLENGKKTTLHVLAQIIKSSTTIKCFATYKSGSTIDTNTNNYRAAISLTVTAAANINLTETASNYTPNYLYHTILTIVVKNSGPNSAQNVNANCRLDPKLLKSISDDSKGCYNPQTGIWAIGTLRSGSKITLHIQTKILVFKTIIKNLASYKSDTYDISPRNNSRGIVLNVPALTINSLASSLAIGTTSNYDKAVNIFNWVRDHIEYSFYYNTKYGAAGTLNAMKETV